MLMPVKSVSEENLRHPLRYIQHYLYIKPKRGNKVIPFFLNRAQVIYYRLKQEGIRQGKLNSLLLKYRQGGFSTFEIALNFHCAATQSNQSVLTIANKKQTTVKMFRIANLFYRHLDLSVKPNRNFYNKAEIEFRGRTDEKSLNSIYSIDTAGDPDVGRGGTYNRIHCGEVPRWKANKNYDEMEDVASGLIEANLYGENVFEGSPAGKKGWFPRKWIEAKNGENDFNTIFIPWFFDNGNVLPLEEGEEIMPTDEEKDFINMVKTKHNMPVYAEQIKFRRAKKKMYDKLYRQEYPEDDISCFIAGGLHFFDIGVITELIPKCKPVIETRDNGCIQIWEKPKPDTKYCAGGDVAKGNPDSDFSTIGIIKYETGEQVAKFRGRVRPEVYATKGMALCTEYNQALWGIEENNHGHSAINTARNTLFYQNLYYRENGECGWITNGKTRTPMLDELHEAVSRGWMVVNDLDFCDEAMTFDDNVGLGKYEAKTGYYDDSILSWGIAWQVRKQGFHNIPKIRVITTQRKDDN